MYILSFSLSIFFQQLLWIPPTHEGQKESRDKGRGAASNHSIQFNSIQEEIDCVRGAPGVNKAAHVFLKGPTETKQKLCLLV